MLALTRCYQTIRARRRAFFLLPYAQWATTGKRGDSRKHDVQADCILICWQPVLDLKMNNPFKKGKMILPESGRLEVRSSPSHAGRKQGPPRVRQIESEYPSSDATPLGRVTSLLYWLYLALQGSRLEACIGGLHVEVKPARSRSACPRMLMPKGAWVLRRPWDDLPSTSLPKC